MDGYRDPHGAVRYPHPAVEIAEIDRQLAALTEKRDALVALRLATGRLLAAGYTRRQTRIMAGYDPITPPPARG